MRSFGVILLVLLGLLTNSVIAQAGYYQTYANQPPNYWGSPYSQAAPCQKFYEGYPTWWCHRFFEDPCIELVGARVDKFNGSCGQTPCVVTYWVTIVYNEPCASCTTDSYCCHPEGFRNIQDGTGYTLHAFMGGSVNQLVTVSDSVMCGPVRSEDILTSVIWRCSGRRYNYDAGHYEYFDNRIHWGIIWHCNPCNSFPDQGG